MTIPACFTEEFTGLVPFTLLQVVNTPSSAKIPDSKSSTAVNLFQEVSVEEEKTKNYTYTDMGQQLMILDIRAPVSISGILWMTQYLAEFSLQIEDMKSIKCNQPFLF